MPGIINSQSLGGAVHGALRFLTMRQGMEARNQALAQRRNWALEDDRRDHQQRLEVMEHASELEQREEAAKRQTELDEAGAAGDSLLEFLTAEESGFGEDISGEPMGPPASSTRAPSARESNFADMVRGGHLTIAQALTRLRGEVDDTRLADKDKAKTLAEAQTRATTLEGLQSVRQSMVKAGDPTDAIDRTIEFLKRGSITPARAAGEAIDAAGTRSATDKKAQARAAEVDTFLSTAQPAAIFGALQPMAQEGRPIFPGSSITEAFSKDQREFAMELNQRLMSSYGLMRQLALGAQAAGGDAGMYRVFSPINQRRLELEDQALGMALAVQDRLKGMDAHQRGQAYAAMAKQAGMTPQEFVMAIQEARRRLGGAMGQQPAGAIPAR